MMKKVWFSFLLVGALILVTVVCLLVGLNTQQEEHAKILEKFPDRGAPRMNITLNGVGLDEINSSSKEIEYDGNKLDLYDGDNIKEFGEVQMKGRGNGTWTQEKKPYQIKFSKKVDLFGMGKAKKWVLLANAMDVSNLRTAAAFYLEEMLDMKYRFQGKFVELYVNDEYEGLYYLTHAVEIGKNVVDLKNPMGILVELDNLYYVSEEYYESGNGDHLVIKDVVSENNKEAAMQGFLRDFDELEKAILVKNYERIDELIDVESFAQYYLLSEFSVNPDAYWTSFYMYKDGLNDKIHAGPGWDFDLAFANRRWGNWMGEAFYSSETKMVRKGELLSLEEYEALGLEDWEGRHTMSRRLSRIIFELMDLPEFNNEVVKQYQEKMDGNIKDLVIKIKEWAISIEELIQVDNKKWNKGDYVKEVEDMTRWIECRSEAFEKEYGGLHDDNKMLSLN